MKAKKVSNATADHDFTYVKSALLLKLKKMLSRIARVPHIQKPGEDDVRHSFLEFDGYETFWNAYPYPSRVFSPLAIRSEIECALLRLKWSQVDFAKWSHPFIRLQNRKPIPMASPIYWAWRSGFTA